MANEIRDLQHRIHVSMDKTAFIATSAGDSSFQSQITGMLDPDNSYDKEELVNHIGREYYKKLHYLNLTPTNMDELDSSFRPTTLTGLYEAP